MDGQKTNPSDKPEASTEVRPINHDLFFIGTFAMKRLAMAFLRIILPKELLACLDLEGLSAEPRHITDELFKQLVADVVYRVPIKGTDKHIDFFVITEHKSYNDKWTIFQLWIYVLHVVRREFERAKLAEEVDADYELPPVIAIILYHGESRFTGKTQLSEMFLQLPGIEKYLPTMQAILVDLSAIDDNDIPDDPDAPELKLVLMALKLIFREDIAEKIKEIIEGLGSVDPVLQEVLRMTWYYATASGRHMEHDYEILYNSIKQIVEVESMPTMLEKWTAEAVAREKIDTGRNLLLAILREKFNRIPKDTERTILAMNDSVALQSWAVQASMSQTLDEFIEALG